MSHARPRLRTATLASATLTLTAALTFSLVSTAPAAAAPGSASTTTAHGAVATAVTGVTAATTPTAALTPAERKAARTKARKQARKAYELRIRKKVVRIAKRKVGRAQYVAGATGPNRFDCSGLALYVWRKAAGRKLPHYSGAQAAVTKNVSRKNIKPGDLVFFMNGGHHVGIYIGHGKMVGATNPRSDIKVDRVWSGWYGQRYSGAGRLFN